MTNCPNCGAPLKKSKCMYCGTEAASATIKTEEEIIDGETTYYYERESPVAYPIIGKLNGKPVIRALHPFQVPENPEFGTVLVNDTDEAYMFREDGWRPFPLARLLRNERLWLSGW